MTVSPKQRRQIRELAGGCCEYCRADETRRFTRFKIDHIIPLKHGGKDESGNLCLACLKCNSFKGPNVAALDPQTGDATKLYNPRQQRWDYHFEILANAVIEGISPEGRATFLVLRLNEETRVMQRKTEMMTGRYPCKAR